MHFGRSSVNGRSRSPLPPARMIACITSHPHRLPGIEHSAVPRAFPIIPRDCYCQWVDISHRTEPMMQAPRGMHDILPDEAVQWQALEARARAFAARFGYREIRTPIVEHTEVFQRTSGETSDLIEKEMYTFADRGGRSLSLRPEGTSGDVL